jgi:hypothetical protein
VGHPRITYLPGFINKVPTPNTVFLERETTVFGTRNPHYQLGK